MDIVTEVKKDTFLETLEGLNRRMYYVVEDGLHCPICGGDDYLVIRDVADNATGLFEGEYMLSDNYVGNVFKECEKNVIYNLNHSNNKFIKYPQSKNDLLKQRIIDYNTST